MWWAQPTLRLLPEGDRPGTDDVEPAQKYPLSPVPAQGVPLRIARGHTVSYHLANGDA